MADENTLLKDLAALARSRDEEDRQRGDQRWEALSAGTLHADEERRLLKEARSSTEARLSFEAFRPLDAEFRARVVERLRQELAGSADDAPSGGSPPSDDSGSRGPASGPRSEDPGAPSGGDNLLHWPADSASPLALEPPQLTGANTWKSWGLAASLLLAVGVTLILGPSFSRQPLPPYELTIEGMTRGQRSAEEPAAEIPIFDRGNLLTLTLRPQQQVEGQVEPTFFLQRDGVLQRWMPRWQRSESGAIRVSGTLGSDLVIEPGELRLIVVLSRAGTAAEADIERRIRTPEAADEGWMMLQQPIVVRGD